MSDKNTGDAQRMPTAGRSPGPPRLARGPLSGWACARCCHADEQIAFFSGVAQSATKITARAKPSLDNLANTVPSAATARSLGKRLKPGLGERTRGETTVPARQRTRAEA